MNAVSLPEVIPLSRRRFLSLLGVQALVALTPAVVRSQPAGRLPHPGQNPLIQARRGADGALLLYWQDQNEHKAFHLNHHAEQLWIRCDGRQPLTQIAGHYAKSRDLQPSICLRALEHMLAEDLISTASRKMRSAQGFRHPLPPGPF